MNDRELLEAAAKADGMHFGLSSEGLPGLVVASDGDGRQGWCRWNPLTDDGDALRLAVALRLNLRITTLPHAVYLEAYNGGAPSATESLSDTRQPKLNPQAATRRAIVRAAAAIGGAA